jgi:shikimate kinase
MHTCRKIFLIGFMGSGKSTTGKKLAARLGWSFVDLDKEIEKLSGLTIPEIFSQKGEAWFRETEASVLREIEDSADSVVSTGGGTPCYGDNMDYMLKSGITIYLRLTPGQLENRLLNSKPDRPLIRDVSKKDMHDFIVKKLEEREKWYSRSTFIVDGFKADDSLLFSLVRERIQD